MIIYTGFYGSLSQPNMEMDWTVRFFSKIVTVLNNHDTSVLRTTGTKLFLTMLKFDLKLSFLDLRHDSIEKFCFKAFEWQTLFSLRNFNFEC